MVCISIIVINKTGSVYYLNDGGKLVQQFMAEGPVRKLLYYEEKNILVTITTSMMLTQHAVSQEGETREIIKVRLESSKIVNWVLYTLYI